MKYVAWFSLALLAAATSAWANPEVPGAKQERPIAIVGGIVHPASGDPIEAGTVVFVDGKITAVGTNVEIPDGAEQIDATGMHVYPGLIEAFSDLGLVEIPAVRASVDVAELGSLNPNVQATVAYNADSELIPTVRSNGVLLALVAPDGGLISGQSALMRLDGWNWEDAAQRQVVAMHINWPRMTPLSAWWAEDSRGRPRGDRDDALDALDALLADARAYAAAKQAEAAGGPAVDYDARLAAMGLVLSGELPCIISANRREEIETAVNYCAAEGIRPIIYGGYDAEACAELLKRLDVPVIISGVHRLPLRRHSPYDEAYTLPARLREAGVRFCISGAGRWSSMARNLPYHAGTAAAFGLSRGDALRSITLWPAEILGVADEVGSLDVGKDATLFIASGDILETPNNVSTAFIQGRPVELNDRHKRLWRKYEERLNRGSQTD